MEPMTKYLSRDPTSPLIPEQDWQINIFDSSGIFNFTNHKQIEFMQSISNETW